VRAVRRMGRKPALSFNDLVLIMILPSSRWPSRSAVLARTCFVGRSSDDWSRTRRRLDALDVRFPTCGTLADRTPLTLA